MSYFPTEFAPWLGSRGHLVAPLVLAGLMAVGDVRTRRIPNYLTGGTALAGLAYQVSTHGLEGLGYGLGGLFLGLGLLLLPYMWGGLGAGDVKALAALGAWLGPYTTLYLFCYMGIAGGLLALGVLVWKGLLWAKMRQGWIFLWNILLSHTPGSRPVPAITFKTKGIPYGVAIAVGMAVLVWRGG